MSNDDSLLFPSGRSVGNCRKDAKRLSKSEQIPLNQALDKIAVKNGLIMPWAKAMSQLPDIQSQQCAMRVGGQKRMTESDIREILSRHPELTHYGIGISSRGINSIDEYLNKFASEQDQLVRAVDECNKALLFLSFATKRKSMNTKHSSYGLKHSVERYMKQLPHVHNYYVANGSFICAAIHAGFSIVPIRNGSPNVFINISERSPILIWGKLKPRSYKTPTQSALCDQIERDIGIPPNHSFQEW